MEEKERGHRNRKGTTYPKQRFDTFLIKTWLPVIYHDRNTISLPPPPPATPCISGPTTSTPERNIYSLKKQLDSHRYEEPLKRTAIETAKRREILTHQSEDIPKKTYYVSGSKPSLVVSCTFITIWQEHLYCQTLGPQLVERVHNGFPTLKALVRIQPCKWLSVRLSRSE